MNVKIVKLIIGILSMIAVSPVVVLSFINPLVKNHWFMAGVDYMVVLAIVWFVSDALQGK